MTAITQKLKILKKIDQSLKIRLSRSSLRIIVNLQNECRHSQINTKHVARDSKIPKEPYVDSPAINFLFLLQRRTAIQQPLHRTQVITNNS